MSARRPTLVSALILVVIVVAMWALLFRSAPRTHGPLRHEVYVWQRAWTQPVREAVSQRATNFAATVALKAEISWNTNRQPQRARVAVDYATLSGLRRPVGFALRIAPYPGPFPQPDTAAERAGREVRERNVTDYLCDVAAGLADEALTNGVPPAELQLDFDCAESKLDGYRVWVEAIQRRVAPLPVTITALPSWLDSSAFKRLAAVATNYVLQVHSVARPKGFDAPLTLCDPGAARRAVERAGRIGVPFRVALPTYGYTLAFEPTGKFLGLSAEGPRPNWPANAGIREVSSNPAELAALVRDWTASRPEPMRGVIWYRMPVSADQHNWRWPTLEAVLDGRVPVETGKPPAAR